MHALRRFLPLFVALLACATGTGTPPRTHREADDLDAFVTAQMARRHVPGLSLAIIQDGRIV